MSLEQRVQALEYKVFNIPNPNVHEPSFEALLFFIVCWVGGVICAGIVIGIMASVYECFFGEIKRTN